MSEDIKDAQVENDKLDQDSSPEDQTAVQNEEESQLEREFNNSEQYDHPPESDGDIHQKYAELSAKFEKMSQNQGNVSALKAKLKDLEQQVKSSKQPVQTSVDDDLSDIEKENREIVRKNAEALGYVSKSDLDTYLNQRTIKQYEDRLIRNVVTKYGEDGVDKVSDIWISEGKPRPQTAEEWERMEKRLIERAFGQQDGTDPSRLKKAGANEALATAKTNDRLSYGGGNTGVIPKGDTTVSDMMKKYPNLTREQIEKVISDTKSLGKGYFK
jgi:hypothetical protein